MKRETTGLAHLGLRVTDAAHSRHFYGEILGFELLQDMGDVVVCNAYGTRTVLLGNAPQIPTNDRFDPYRVGVDHFALGVPTIAALDSIKQVLDQAGVPNNGIEHDAVMHATFISFADPDGIAGEFYVATAA